MGCPDDARRVLIARAASRGESLNTYLLRLLSQEAERLTVAEVLELASLRVERADVSAVGVVAKARADRNQSAMGPTSP